MTIHPLLEPGYYHTAAPATKPAPPKPPKK
jgi:hypothetical protein